MGKSSKKQGADAASAPFLTAALTELRAQLEVCRVRREELNVGGFDKDLANSAAALGRAVTTLAGEQRQQEKHAKQMVERMTDDEKDALVTEYLAELPPERRAAVRSLLDDLDREEMVLGA